MATNCTSAVATPGFEDVAVDVLLPIRIERGVMHHQLIGQNADTPAVTVMSGSQSRVRHTRPLRDRSTAPKRVTLMRIPSLTSILPHQAPNMTTQKGPNGRAQSSMSQTFSLPMIHFKAVASAPQDFWREVLWSTAHGESRIRPHHLQAQTVAKAMGISAPCVFLCVPSLQRRTLAVPKSMSLR